MTDGIKELIGNILSVFLITLIIGLFLFWHLNQ